MDVKQAVVQAKSYVHDLFQEEGPVNVALEEVEFDTNANEWLITIGFSRTFGNASYRISEMVEVSDPRRSYKVVRISDDTGEVRSVKIQRTA